MKSCCINFIFVIRKEYVNLQVVTVSLLLIFRCLNFSNEPHTFHSVSSPFAAAQRVKYSFDMLPDRD